MITRKKKHNQVITIDQEDVPSGVPQKVLEDLDSFKLVDVDVNTVQDAEGLFLQERNETVDQDNKRLLVVKLKVGNQPHRDRLYKEFTDASEKLNVALKELQEVENHPYNRFLKSVVKAATNKLEDAERILLHKESLYKEEVFGNIGSKQLSLSLEHARSLVTLDLSHDLIKAPGVEFLSPFISTSETLRTLNLSNNPLGPKGARVLQKALSENKHLETLILFSCHLESDGCSAILNTVLDHPHLVHLNLRNNKMMTHGTHTVAEVIRKNTELEFLDISTNDFGVEGLEVIAGALTENSTLLEINVKYNGVNADLRKPEHQELLLSLRKGRIHGVWDI